MKTPDLSKPVAAVNGVKITLKELQREMKKTQDNYAMQNIFPDEAELKQLEKEILDQLIERELLWQQAVHHGLVADDKTVLAELEAIKKQYINDQILNNILKNQNISMEEFLRLIKKDLTIKKVIEGEIAGTIAISDTACQSYYLNHLSRFTVPEKIRASHICIFVHEDAPDTERQKAETAMQFLARRLKQGENFENLAREASQCASSERGGDLGFIAKGSMDPKFEEAAFGLKLHEVSPIVRSSVGYHIIKITDRTPARVMPFDEVKKTVLQELKDQETDNKLQNYVAELLKQANVELWP